MEPKHDMVMLDFGAYPDGVAQTPPGDSRIGLAGCPIHPHAEGETTESETEMKHGEVTSAAGGFFSAPDWVFDLDDIDTYTKLTLLYLYRRADKDYKCFPAAKRACTDLGCSKPRLLESIANLEAAGLLVVTRSKKPDGSNAPNNYFLPIRLKKRQAGEGSKAYHHGKRSAQGDGKPNCPEGHTGSEGHTYNNHCVSPNGSTRESVENPNAAETPTGSEDGPADNSSPAKEKPRAASKAVSVALCQACQEAWGGAFGGVFPFGRLRKALGPLRRLHGESDIEAGFKRYLSEVEPRYASPEGFVSKAGTYIAGRPNGAPAMVDDFESRLAGQ